MTTARARRRCAAGRPWLGAALAAAALALLPRTSAAQSCSTGTTAGSVCTTPIAIPMSLPVGDVLRLTLSSTTASLGTVDAAAYTAGFTTAPGPTVTVKANRAYRVQMVGAASTFSYTGSLTNPNKPASQLRWGTVNGTYANDASVTALVLQGAGGAPAQGATAPSQQIFFQTQWSMASDVPGTYALLLSFTISAP